MEWFSLAHAMGASGQGTGGQGGGFAAFLPLLLMIAIFYFLLIRPQQRKQKEHRTMLANLQRGDSVITQGGLHGKITGLTDTVATLEVADKVRVKVQRAYIAAVVSRGEAIE